MMPVKNLVKLFICILFANTAYADSNFLVITDIHLDLSSKHKMQFSPSKQGVKNDLDKPTFTSLIHATDEAIKKGNVAKPDFILILGDINGHKRLNKDLKSTEAYVFTTLKTQFKNTPILYVFGNNDSPQRNYGKFTWRKLNPYLIATANSHWHNGFLSTGKLCNDDNTFPCISNQNINAGYFSAMLKPNLRLLGVNSVLFSINNLFHRAASKELNWLRQELKSATLHNQQVIITMHIPPGYNIYNNEAFWRKSELKEFKKIINQYNKTIIGMLAAHTHQEELKVYTHQDQKIGIYSTAALSTAYGNSPSIKTYNLRKTNSIWHINNYTTYKFSLQQDNIRLNKVYDFQAVYCKKPTNDINKCLDNVNIQKIHQYMSVANPNQKGIIRAPQQMYLYGD